MATETKVIFRQWPNGDVIALFPDIDAGHGLISSYEHIGQHDGADYHHVVRQTRPATQFQDLASELSAIGYNLKIAKKLGARRKTCTKNFSRDALLS